MLDINGYIVRSKVVKRIRTGAGKYKWKSNLDVELALEMIKLKNKFDTAILVSGDSDFAVALDWLKYVHTGKGSERTFGAGKIYRPTEA